MTTAAITQAFKEQVEESAPPRNRNVDRLAYMRAFVSAEQNCNEGRRNLGITSRSSPE